MTAPFIVTGSILATGVKVPNLPTCRSIATILLIALSGSNLYAIAPLGALEVLPKLYLWLKSDI